MENVIRTACMKTANMTTSNFVSDVKAGYNDAKAGVYDKWFRYHRQDDGAAYAAGQMAAVKDGAIVDNIIPCNQF